MKRINLGTSSEGRTVYIDIPTLVSTRLLVTASSGGGKSETLRRILEEAVSEIQCIVIDPEGEFSTLREKKPFVLVGEGGETPADIRTAALVATRLLELNASAVCDIYEMRVQDRHEWVKRFLDSMVHAPKSLWHPVLVVIDEAHTYCPEAGYGKSVAAQSVIDIANLGRKRGFCAILATQRLSKLDKNAVEPLQNYLVGRTMFDDQERAAKTFKVKPGADTRDFSLELERLKDGEFIARGRAINGDMLKVQVTRGITRPPSTGKAMAGVVTPTPSAIKALLPKLADLPHEAEKKVKTEEDLRIELRTSQRRITDLETQLKQAPPSTPMAPDQDAIQSIVSKEADAILHHLHSVIGIKMSKMLEELGTRLKDGGSELISRSGEVGSWSNWELEYFSKESMSAMKKIKMVPAAPPAAITNARLTNGKIDRVIAGTGAGDGSLPKGERSVLTALAQHGPSRNLQISIFTGFARSTRDKYLQLLSQKGMVSKEGDVISITPLGSEALGSYETLPIGSDLQQWWLAKLPKGEATMLEVLCKSGRPTLMDKEALSNLTGFARSTRDKYIQLLAQKLLIKSGPTGVIASEDLF